MGQIADLSSHGTDTKRVEKLREILADHYKQRENIRVNYLDILKLVEEIPERYEEESSNQIKAQSRLRRITINRFSTVLSEDWDGD